MAAYDERDIGRLCGLVEILHKDLERANEKLDALAGLKARVDRIEPLVDRHEEVKNKWWGAALLAGLAGGAAGHKFTDLFK